MKMMKLFAGVVSVAIVLAVAAPIAEAQCAAGARSFASIGGGTDPSKLRIDPAGTAGGASDSVGTEIGRFWQADDSASGNNFEGNCPTQGATQAGGGWWQIANTTERGVFGLITGTGCFASTCPVGDFIVLVEDYGPSGPPGVGDSASFVGWRVNETPPDIRYWDLSRFCEGATNCTIPFVPYPVPMIISATKNDVTGERDLTADAADMSLNVYVYNTQGPQPASGIIQSYDLMISHGAGDPGRDRQNWSLLGQIPYNDSGLAGQPITVPCDTIVDDSYIAFGATFVGGPPGGPVESALVGQAIQIECDPNLADPGGNIRPEIRRPVRTDRAAPRVNTRGSSSGR
jgi:hypothetical protein